MAELYTPNMIQKKEQQLVQLCSCGDILVSIYISTYEEGSCCTNQAVICVADDPVSPTTPSSILEKSVRVSNVERILQFEDVRFKKSKRNP